MVRSAGGHQEPGPVHVVVDPVAGTARATSATGTPCRSRPGRRPPRGQRGEERRGGEGRGRQHHRVAMTPAGSTANSAPAGVTAVTSQPVRRPSPRASASAAIIRPTWEGARNTGRPVSTAAARSAAACTRLGSSGSRSRAAASAGLRLPPATAGRNHPQMLPTSGATRPCTSSPSRRRTRAPTLSSPPGRSSGRVRSWRFRPLRPATASPTPPRRPCRPARPAAARGSRRRATSHHTYAVPGGGDQLGLQAQLGAQVHRLGDPGQGRRRPPRPGRRPPAERSAPCLRAGRRLRGRRLALLAESFSHAAASPLIPAPTTARSTCSLTTPAARAPPGR